MNQKNGTLLQSQVQTTRDSQPLIGDVHERFDDSQIETELQFVSINDEQMLQCELPILNEPKHGNALFETIRTKESIELSKKSSRGRKFKNQADKSPKSATKRELFESYVADRNEIRNVHEERLNDSFVEDVQSIVLQEG